MSAVSARALVHTPFAKEICPWTSLLSPFTPYSYTPSDEFTLLDQNKNTEWATAQATQVPIRNHELHEDVWIRTQNCVDQYCVFSNSGLYGQGMAVVTNSQSQRLIEQSQNSTVHIGLGEPKYRVAQIPGKGNGLIANGTIRRGEPIIASKPALLVHQGVFGELDLEDIYQLLESAVDKLPQARKASYLAQAGKMGGHRIVDILFTNSYQMSVGGHEGFHHYGNFPAASLFNHDCRPNLVFYIDENLIYHTHAIRDIKPGEELTVSYLDPFEPRSARQERARHGLGFSCSCSLCSASQKEIDASDARLRSIKRIEDELGDFGSRLASPALIEKLVGLYEKEGLGFKMAGAYTLAALNYNLFGMAEPAQRYARMAVEAGRLENGPEAPDVREMQELWDDPKTHWTWDLRRYG
ncbi:hypothetical protein F4809DRAFT_650437 [Biscogniauxia mediterranea]|nr:hypothetical protein F4809DRAFT_650437 [Biscogniauxia mediterranea]